MHETVGFQTNGKVTGIVRVSKSEETSCWRERNDLGMKLMEWTAYSVRGHRADQNDIWYAYATGDIRRVVKE